MEQARGIARTPWKAAYRLRLDEPATAGLDRIYADQIERARAVLEDPSEDPFEAVYEARRSIKRARSVLRFVRGPLGSDFSDENARMQSVAKLLAPRREAGAALETLDRLAERFAGRLPATALAAGRRRMEGLLYSAPDVRTEAARALEAPKLDLEAHLPKGDWEILEPGITRTYARGRSALRRAAKKGTTAAFHAWRKRVKDLWHQTELLVESSPSFLKPVARNAHDLADLLGDAHDLDELERLLEPRGRQRAVGRAPASLSRLIAELRAEDRAAALRLGERVYAERPKAFVRRMETYWAAWRRETPIEASVVDAGPGEANAAA
jgi:CHAD domain-containing protein